MLWLAKNSLTLRATGHITLLWWRSQVVEDHLWSCLQGSASWRCYRMVLWMVWFIVWPWGRNLWCTRHSTAGKVISIIVVLTETVTVLKENTTCTSWTNSLLLLSDCFVILHVSGGRITRFVAELMAVQWNSFNAMSNNLQVLIIWFLTRVVLRPEVLLFYWKNVSAMKQADTTVMFKKAFSNVCTSTVAISYDPLSPTLLPSSAVQDSSNFKRVPWTSRWWTYIQVEYSSD